MITEELKKQTTHIDLAIQAGRKRQSPRTGFVHLHHGDEATDTIPTYENFCFALALFRHKTADSVTEGKELIDRLLSFQTSDGNFPFYLHDYPRCFDYQMPYKVAPLLIYILRLFSPVLGELKPKIEHALNRALSKKPEKTSWENRYRACLGEPLIPVETDHFSPTDWTEWLITAQLAGQTHFTLPYQEDLQLLFTPTDLQEKHEPRPNPIEWLLASGQFTPRLLRDHPHQLLAAPLFPITFTPKPTKQTDFRLFWKDSTIHSLTAPSLVFNLPEGLEINRNDLFEASLFCDISPETHIFINGSKATTFKLGDTITIQTPSKTISLTFELTSGFGDFCGHIFRANRPSQVANKGINQYEAYDWQIGLRTLRRTGPAQITIKLQD